MACCSTLDSTLGITSGATLWSRFCSLGPGLRRHESDRAQLRQPRDVPDARPLDDLYEATLQPDGSFCSEQMEAIAKLAEEAMGCVLSVLDPEMYDTVQRDCPGKNVGCEARRFAVQA